MALYGDVQFLPRWPGIPFGDEEGEIISGVLGDHWSALLAHHGLIVGGKTIEQATYRAYFFEYAARLQMLEMSALGSRDLSSLPVVERELADAAREWRASDGATKAHFNAWARRAIRNGHSDVLTH